ncbi:MAG: transcriptional regulator, TraR/DksA family [Moraxellaceae bacterium]|jgi:RNA polymerase-binding transcription factor DksA|nr:transcriptional regulator, TraR/DksA family [Moraxellaceae bacterium]
MSQDVKARLLQLQAEFARRAEATQRDLQQPAPQDWDEQAQHRQNDEVLEGLRAEARYELVRVNDALARLEAGRYGQCTRCGAEIAAGRLAAVPQADLCSPCAELTGR